MQAHDLALALGVGGDRDYGGDRDHPSALALAQIGGVQPQIGPLALKGPVKEGVHPLVDLLAQLRDLALRDAGQPHRLHEVVHLAGGNARDPCLLDHGDQRLLARLAGFQERREVGTLAKLRDAQLKRSEARVERALAIAVAPRQALGAALVPSSADHALDIGFHQHLEHRFSNAAQGIAVPALLDQVGQWHSVVGHRDLLVVGSKSANSTLANHPDGHPQLHRLSTEFSTTSVDATAATSDDLVALTEHAILSAMRDWEILASGAEELRLSVNVTIEALTRLPIVSLIRENRPSSP